MIYYKRDDLRYIVRREDYSIITLLNIAYNHIDKKYNLFDYVYKEYNRKEIVQLLLYKQLQALLIERDNFS